MPDEIQTASDAASAPSPPPEENLSLSDHEARYGEGASTQAEPSNPPAELPAAEPDSTDDGTPETEDAAGPRDEKTGRFLPKPKHHSAKHAARQEDAPRIRDLVAQVHALEAERDALRTPAPVVPRETPVVAAEKPTPDKFTDYSEYVEALTDWKTDQKLAAAEQRRVAAEQQRSAEIDRQRLTRSWTERVQAAKARYPDFDQIALQSDTVIPQGSLIDAWILEHESGADVLYYLQQHPNEVHDLLSRPLLKQAEGLVLLTQRFNGHSSRTAAAPTGSAPAQSLTPTPRPPNPVRTGPLRTGDEPPDEEVASLADHEKWYSPRRARGG